MFVSTVTDQSRKFVYGCVETYRYGMNGQEREDEVLGNEGITSAEYWMYDSRIGRRFENDPMTYSWQSPYVAFNDNPIYFSDPLGLEGEGGGEGVGDAAKQTDKGKNKKPAADNSSSKNTTHSNKEFKEKRTLTKSAEAEEYAKQQESEALADRTPQEVEPKKMDLPAQALPEGAITADFHSMGSAGEGYPTVMQGSSYVPPKENPIVSGVRSFLNAVEKFNFVSNSWDAASNLMYGTDKYGHPQGLKQFGYNIVGSIPLINFETQGARPFMVGTYDELKAVSTVGDGLDIHHAGQAHVYEQIIPGYSRATGPCILLPKAMHDMIPNIRGIVSPNLNPRVVLLQDALNLRKVGVPSEDILNLINLNKKMYPGSFLIKIPK